MIQEIYLYIKQILSFDKFKSTQLPQKVFKELLTAFSEMKNKDVILFPELINKVSSLGGTLIVDETINSKYGLKSIARKLKNLTNGGYCNGYKVVLFLWNKDGLRIPLGFGLYHKESGSVSDITMNFISRLRNDFNFYPEMFVADGAYDIDKLIKRLTDYGWRCVIRCRSTRNLDRMGGKKLIPRGYGEAKGLLRNYTKVKIFRRKNRFYLTNRMFLTMQKAVDYYTLRWKIEESFRFLKSCIGIKRCQQHRTIFQEVFIWMCLITFSYFSYQESISGHTIYKCFHNVIFGIQKFELALLKKIFNDN